MMKNLLMAGVIGAGFLGAQAANYPSVWRTVADGGTVVAARNRSGTRGPWNQMVGQCVMSVTKKT